MDNAASARLRKARSDAGYPSAAAAARAFGWNESTYRHHENGTRGFDRDHIEAYSRAFKVSPLWLYGAFPSEEHRAPDEEEAITQSLREPSPLPEPLADLNNDLIRQLGLRLVPEVEMAVFANLPERTWPRPERYQAFSEDLLLELAKVDVSDLVVVREVSGRMSPTVKVGSLLIIDLGHTEIDSQDELWLVLLGWIPAIRRVRMLERYTAEISADDPKVTTSSAKLTELVIWGKVKWVGSTV